MTRTLRPGARFRYGGFYLPDAEPGCWSVRIETRDGIVQRVDTKGLGLASVLLGAGRQRAEDVVDHAVGLSIVAKSGTEVRAGDALVKVHVHNASDADKIVDRLRAAYVIGEDMPTVAPLHLGRIEV